MCMYVLVCHSVVFMCVWCELTHTGTQHTHVGKYSVFLVLFFVALGINLGPCTS